MSAEPVFWGCLALAAYAFAGYPLLAIGLARWRGTPCPQGDARPPLTVVIAARDESARIGARLRNLFACDYPADRLAVLVVDDGSRDDTAAQATAVGDPRVSVLRLTPSGGKAAALNAALAQVRTPLTVFADARQSFSRGTLAALAAPFSDPHVGVVAGELHLRAAGAGAHAVAADGLYQRLERALRRAEGELGWAHAASGAVYALRTDLFRPLPPGLLLDDVLLPLQARQAGARICVAPEAIALDEAGSDLSREFARKLRTLVGNWQLLAARPWLLHPARNPVFWPWLSHKVLRLMAPWALLGALLAAAFAGAPLVRAAFWLQVAGYGVAAAALLAPRLLRRVPLATAAGSFVALNSAALLSLPLWLSGRDPLRLWRR
jgi:biofilm PGA synthesis N-glycosyltransferase PgaC